MVHSESFCWGDPTIMGSGLFPTAYFHRIGIRETVSTVLVCFNTKCFILHWLHCTLRTRSLICEESRLGNYSFHAGGGVARGVAKSHVERMNMA